MLCILVEYTGIRRRHLDCTQKASCCELLRICLMVHANEVGTWARAVRRATVATVVNVYSCTQTTPFTCQSTPILSFSRSLGARALSPIVLRAAPLLRVATSDDQSDWTRLDLSDLLHPEAATTRGRPRLQRSSWKSHPCLTHGESSRWVRCRTAHGPV